ncbi:MAG: hypothetical protein V7746_19295 [Halioglobus sp.]
MINKVKTRVCYLACLVILMVGHVLTATASVQGSNDTSFVLGPPNQSGPTTVYVGFFLSDVTDIDEEREMFEFESVLTLNWHDERQAFDPKALGTQELIYQGQFQFNEVFNGWWPQLVVANESGLLERQGVTLRIKPDGSMTYIEEMDAVVKTTMKLHHLPFDNQSFEIIFKTLGFDRSEVLLVPDPANTGYRTQGVGMAQWDFEDMDVFSLAHDLNFADGHHGARSHIAVRINMARNPHYMLRLVVVPLFILVMLSWSIFWMDRESLGDRMDISFIGMLTVVAYQIMISEILPRIDYFTLMSTFLYLSFLSIAAGVVINLSVARLDRLGREEEGNKLDRRCRWLFPAVYLGLNAIGTVYFLVLT